MTENTSWQYICDLQRKLMIISGVLVILFFLLSMCQASELKEVARKDIEIDTKIIERIVLEFLDKKMPWDKNRVKIKLTQNIKSIILPDKPYVCKVIPPVRTNYLGTIPLSVVFDIHNQTQKKVSVSVKIEVDTDVVVVQNPLNRNQIISEDDVEVISMDMAELPSNYISSLSEVVGKRALRAINPKEILRSDIIELPPLVRKNDIVSIILESGALKISMIGEARESGRSGDRIKVVNLDSKKEIFARVLDSKTVRVDF